MGQKGPYLLGNFRFGIWEKPFLVGERVDYYWFIRMFSVGLPFLCPFNVETDKTADINGSIKHLGVNEANKIKGKGWEKK